MTPAPGIKLVEVEMRPIHWQEKNRVYFAQEEGIANSGSLEPQTLTSFGSPKGSPKQTDGRFG